VKYFFGLHIKRLFNTKFLVQPLGIGGVAFVPVALPGYAPA